MTLPAISLLRNEIEYNAETGEMHWKSGKQGRNADLSVSTSLQNGYRRIHLNGKTYLAHRVAFAIFHGREPSGEIDHIDRNPLNNAIANLREADRTLNAYNKNSRGVSRHPKRKARPFQARIFENGRHRSLGTYATEDEARAAYAAAQAAILSDLNSAGTEGVRGLQCKPSKETG